MVTISTFVATVLLFLFIPKGFFPVQDTGVILGISEAPQTVSFSSMAQRQQKLVDVLLKDEAVDNISSFIGVDGTNTTLNSGRIQINLKPLESRKISATEVIRRLQPKLESVQGIQLFLQPLQDLTVEDRISRTQFQYSLEDPDQAELAKYTRLLVQELGKESVDDRRGPAICRIRAWVPSWSSIATPQLAWVLPWPTWTTRSTTPSASARFPPSSPSSTSTTWSWKWGRTSRPTPAP